MDTKEAIKRIEDHVEVHHIGEGRHILIGAALDLAILALQKQIPMEPDSREHRWSVDHYCPVCGKQQKAPGVLQFRNGSYCERCGQKIKWGGSDA